MSDESLPNLKPEREPGVFAATQWSLVLRARENSESALNILLGNYRLPLLVWLRNNKETPEDAEDFVQGFMAHLLSRDFLSNVAREKGKFRTFLLRCLKNYVADQKDAIRAGKRGGGQKLSSLDETDDEGKKLLDPAASHPSPDKAYDQAWVKTIIENARHRLQAECARERHEALYAELEPVIQADDSASAYRDIGQRLKMSEAAIKMAAHRIRARFYGLVQDEIKQTVTDEADWEEELRYLIQLFSK